MKLIKVHRILKFKQSDWLKKFVDFNTDNRKNASNNFEEDFFKLMINSVFGKTMENLRKIICVELINNAKDYIKCVSRPSFVSQKIFSKSFVAVHRIKPVLTLNKPIYVGFSILELNKSMKIKTKDVYENVYLDKGLFDLSDYPLHSKFFDPVNKKLLAI